jgi:hypothetical protein
MSPDDWQAHVTREAAKAIGTWLEARGRLDQPIASLRLNDLDAMASTAISRFVVLASHKIRHAPGHHCDLEILLMGGAAGMASAPSAGGRPGASGSACD